MKLNETPFFSVVIPCYNSRKTIGRLLSSLVDQNMPEDIQVILADDHSTESYEDEIAPYYSKLNIEKISTDYNCCPGNTREKGTTIAKGTWLLFADHDDVFIRSTFKEVRRQILKNNEQYIAYCNIYRSANTTGKFTESLTHRTMTNFNGLLHGKFFNRENLWVKHNLHFKKDMFTHEDTYLISAVKCIMSQLNIEPLHIDLVDYVWFSNTESLSMSSGIRSFLEKHFHYYVEATSDTYRDYFNRGLTSRDFTEYQLIQMVLYEYFYMQMFIFTNPEGYLKHNATICRDDLVATKKLLNLKNVDIFWYAGANHAALYNKVAKECGYGFIPNHSLMEWMNILDKD